MDRTSSNRRAAATVKDRCELLTNRSKRAAADKSAASVKATLPAGLSAPALRALAAAGYTTLDRLATVSDAELAKLHGFGPKALEIIRQALAKRKSKVKI